MSDLQNDSAPSPSGALTEDAPRASPGAPGRDTGDAGETAKRAPEYDAVIFSGGGSRCFWQAGFWETAGPRIDADRGVVLAVSAGVAFACSSLLGTGESTLIDFKRRVAGNPKNFYPGQLMRGRRAFPHERIYRETVLANIGADGLETLHARPEIRALLARAPDGYGHRTALSAALLAHVLNRRDLFVHARWGRRLGFEPELASVRDCSTPEELADLIMHSSCAPPLLPAYRRNGRLVLDGGMIDNAPVSFVPEARNTLIMLSRRYDAHKLPRIAGRTYIQPSEDVPVSEWDYTSPDLVQYTYDLGRLDGERFAKTIESGAAEPGADEPRQQTGFATAE